MWIHLLVIGIFVVFLLFVLNGVFAMAEIALVSAKRAKLRQMAEDGDSKAALALRLSENPERFLSTVQIGITMVGVISGAYGAAKIAGLLSPLIASIPGLAEEAPAISFALVVVMITYFSIVIGELVPKNLALRNAEGIARLMAGPMKALSVAAAPFVWALEVSTRAVMKLFGADSRPEGPTAEELRVLVREGMVTGGVGAEESDMMEGVFDLRDLRTEEVMRPRPKVLFLRGSETVSDVSEKVAGSKQNVFPVYEDSRDNVTGMVGLRDLFAAASAGRNPKVAELMRGTVFVPDNQPALTLLESLRTAPNAAALVADEFGTLRGMVTLDDIAEEVVGDLEESLGLERPVARQTDDGSWIVDGMMEVDALADQIDGLEKVMDEEDDRFQTLGGYIVHYLERLPAEGERFEAGGFQFEIIDMDRQRIDKVLIRAIQPTGADSGDKEDAAAGGREE